jgi:hypothetical protein
MSPRRQKAFVLWLVLVMLFIAAVTYIAAELP